MLELIATVLIHNFRVLYAKLTSLLGRLSPKIKDSWVLSWIPDRAERHHRVFSVPWRHVPEMVNTIEDPVLYPLIRVLWYVYIGENPVL